MTATDWPTTLEPLGFTDEGLIAFQWHLPNGDTTDAINKGELVAIKRGRRLAILVPDLTAWLESLPKTTDAA